MDTVTEPSLSVASLSRKAMVMGFGTKLILGRYPVEGAKPSPINSVLIEDGQLVRAVAFLRIPDGPVCLVSAGDAKFINVYNVSSWKEHNSDSLQECADDDAAAAAQKVETKKWTPDFTYGPHNKRITSLVTTADGAIIFADKFGEVFRLRLSFSPEHKIVVEGDEQNPATFLLQHFSIMSNMFVSSPVPRVEPIANTEDRSSDMCRRLFTCDKDRHVRVSRYPEVYVIEQYLWSSKNVQSVCTSVTEVPYALDEAAGVSSPTEASPAMGSGIHGAPYTYYVTGYEDGQVLFWAARNDLRANDKEEPFQLMSTYTPSEDVGAVVSTVLVTLGHNASGQGLHPRDAPRGLLVAHANSTSLTFIPLFNNMGQHHLHAALVQATSISLPGLPAAMISSDEATALVIQRDGSVSFIRIEEDSDANPHTPGVQLCSFNGNIKVALAVTLQKMPFLEEKIRALVGTQLEGLDLCAQWRHDTVVDPRTRRANQEAGSEDGEESDGEDKAKKAPRKKKKVE